MKSDGSENVNVTVALVQITAKANIYYTKVNTSVKIEKESAAFMIGMITQMDSQDQYHNYQKTTTYSQKYKLNA